MSNSTLEQRLAALEQQVSALAAQGGIGRDEKPWLRVLGIFGGNEGMKEIFDEALKLREQDRQRTRKRTTKKADANRAKS